ncbi:hypothetical protein GALMADRAFT_126423 [Galerina marginata CBS 339.88]|uniref:Major facilitator superfamily (MFS) profile domain-containing protein n=1 Tax=Galerina marginata (strain CBS 339.88) TaxID=685588 RepID=A0A067SPC6_GALM3|nr:hypothetical protein GALMADRAFT_126423 [Galerina marginata CBS 339.88]
MEGIPGNGSTTDRLSSTVESSSLHKSDVENDLIGSVDQAKVKSAVRKLDLTILPVMTMFYFLSFLDRSNIGNARVAGLQKGLKMTDHQYQVAVTVTFVPYILAELPANLLLRKIGPNILMPAILTIWGIIVTLQGFVTSYHGLVVARAFLGLVEGPMFPGIVLYLSGFYTRKELSLRIAFFFSAASLSGAFSGLLAAAIVKMHGVGGKPAWSWIFILEGLFSVVVGLVSFFLVPATPKDSKFLSESQKELIIRRLESDRPFVNPSDSFSVKQVLASIRSPHVVIMFMVYFMGGTGLYGLALFLPSIVNQLGFSANKSQLLSVGPFAAGFVVTLLLAYLSDRYKSRAVPLILVSLLSVAGFSIYLTSKDKHVLYGSLYLMVPGIYGKTPVIAAWISNNSEPYYRRATSIALGFIATNAGGILSTWLYPTKEGPRFHRTTVINLIFTIMVIVLAGINALLLSWKNKQKEHSRAEILGPFSTEKEPDGGVRAWVELGDRHPDFRYVI